MNKYVAIEFDPQLAEPVAAARQPSRIYALLRVWLAAWSERRTRKILASLDPAALEDIGVPHTDTSPYAGPLERYPRVITARKRGC